MSETKETDDASCEVCGLELEAYEYEHPWTLRRKAFKSQKSYLQQRVNFKMLGGNKVGFFGRISQGPHSKFSHSGVMAHSYDVAVPAGTPIVANRDGIVADVADFFKGGGLDPYYRSRANYIILRFSDGSYGRYFHIKHKSARVKKGAEVKKGTVIAECGSTGYSAGPHIHFDVCHQFVKEIGSLRIEGKDGKFKEIENTVANISAKLPLPENFLEFKLMIDPSKHCDGTINLDLTNDDVALVCWRGGTNFAEKAEHAEKIGAKALIIVNNDYEMKHVISQIGVVDSTLADEKDRKDSKLMQDCLIDIMNERAELLSEVTLKIPIFFISAHSGDDLVKSIKSGKTTVRMSSHEHNIHPHKYPYRMPQTVPIRMKKKKVVL